MKAFISTVGILLLATGVAGAQSSANTLTPADKKEGWQLLFDGKTLAGWEPRATSEPAVNGEWTVANGAILCPGTSPGWLSTTDAFGNYVLKLEFRGAEGVNSGVFIRSQKEGQPHLTGYEVQIWDNQPAGFNTGSLVGALKASPTKIVPNEWNRFEITAKGEHILVALNGKTLLDHDDPKHPSAGVIGLQCQKDNKIEFRNLRLKPIH